MLVDRLWPTYYVASIIGLSAGTAYTSFLALVGGLSIFVLLLLASAAVALLVSLGLIRKWISGRETAEPRQRPTPPREKLSDTNRPP